LTRHLHGFAREVALSHDEWRTAIGFLVEAARLTDDKRNEFILASDVLGLSSLVDMVNSAPVGTPSSVLGPFHLRGAPMLAVGGDLLRDNEGNVVFVEGRVLDPDGRPLAGAVLDVWQTAANGLYSNVDLAQEPNNLRARMTVGADGRYAFSTVRPAPYTVPDDGPVGELLRATGRHPWRPAHFHFIVEAPGHRTLVTELFPDDDPYIDHDAVFGVRRGLVVKFERHVAPTPLPRGFALAEAKADIPSFETVAFDFVLAPL
jgi:hydroxyquinol 1,2-dioxygenase